jgi:hypothetical protein
MLFADLEVKIYQLQAYETDLKNIMYHEIDKREVIEYEYA